jgi:hypothetical protein
LLEQTMTVRTPVWLRVLVWVLLPAAGAGLLFGLDRLADLALELPWAPMRGPFRLIHNLPEPQTTIGALVLGALIGLVLALFVDAESLTVRLAGREVVLSRPGRTRTVPRPDIAVAFVADEKLVLLGRTGRELAREPWYLSANRLAPAFRAHGIAWAGQDPYADTYRRWIPDSPDIPADANAVFAARQTALKSGDDRDVEEFREELARLGFVVRDDRKRQYYRRVEAA